METAALVPDHIDAIVFDVIGTLVDEDAAWASTAERLAVEAGVVDTERLRASWVEVLDRHMTSVVDGQAAWRSHQQLVTESAREAILATGGEASAAALAVVASLDAEYPAWPDVAPATAVRSEERRVGKECALLCRSRWSPYH